MATYRRGAKGPEVERIQTRLQELGRYAGPIDRDFARSTGPWDDDSKWSPLDEVTAEEDME